MTYAFDFIRRCYDAMLLEADNYIGAQFIF
jgi:hypothetical protein